jgi:hypothetical protein
LWLRSEQKIAKIRRPLGIRAKSVFVFAQPRPKAGVIRLGRQKPFSGIVRTVQDQHEELRTARNIAWTYGVMKLGGPVPVRVDE